MAKTNVYTDEGSTKNDNGRRSNAVTIKSKRQKRSALKLRKLR